MTMETIHRYLIFNLTGLFGAFKGTPTVIVIITNVRLLSAT